MVEGVDQRQALVEELLRLGVGGGDGMMQVAHARHQLYGFLGSGRRMFLGERRRPNHKRGNSYCYRQAALHKRPPENLSSRIVSAVVKTAKARKQQSLRLRDWQDKLRDRREYFEIAVTRKQGDPAVETTLGN